LDSNKEAENFVHLCKALSRIGFSEHQQELIFRLLAAILHAGNVFFRAKKVLETLKTKIPFEKVAENDEFEEEYAELANEGEVNWIAHLMDIDFGNLKQILTKSSQGHKTTINF
jgi:myosin XV